MSMDKMAYQITEGTINPTGNPQETVELLFDSGRITAEDVGRLADLIPDLDTSFAIG